VNTGAWPITVLGVEKDGRGYILGKGSCVHGDRTIGEGFLVIAQKLIGPVEQRLK